MPRYESTVEKILTLYSTSGGRPNPRAIEAHAARLDRMADRAEALEDHAAENHLRDLAYVHRKAALVARQRQPKRPWWGWPFPR